MFYNSIQQNFAQMIIGIIKEQSPETRVALLPEAISALIDLKTEVLVEKGAGVEAMSSDDKYENAGARILARKEVFKQAKIILMVNPPAEEDIQLLDKDQIIVGTLNPLSDEKLVSQLQKSGSTSFSLDAVPRITRAQAMDVLSSMATVAGYRAVLEAAFNLPTFFPM
ncbi:MAG: NAD(P)(+) transhydrogenase (Re/Si-specific) subunit alpha, partial [Bacteroidetes bacterium]